jgi:hypothetical protein
MNVSTRFWQLSINGIPVYENSKRVCNVPCIKPLLRYLDNMVINYDENLVIYSFV